ncbi:MAG: DNA mismatch repair endonuclease MutL [Firmicutes bacterium]|nr:DNA mismatch repair endonuclease MutL [Bacillota bacterium]
MASIIVLDPFTANQIAAGEVVERPVSVVKELVENALDAGARKVVIDIADGGLGRIAVIDDGCGMEQEDLTLAFERHATSKIKNAADLSRITTLGFRGEALPSIAAVSRVTFTTRPAGAVEGARVEIKGGTLIAGGPAGCPPGTTVLVEELFFNTPARKKAMKSPPAEGALCTDLITRLALSRPDVCFDLRVRGKRVFHSPGTGRLIDAVVAVYGPGQGREMVPVKAGDGKIMVTGYAGKPSFHRSNRSYQTIIVNGRYVRCPAVTAALEEAYRNVIPPGRKPVAVLSVVTDPSLLDVNVHPAKLAVSLLEEEKVTSLVKEAVHEALRGRTAIPALVGKGPANKEFSPRAEKTFTVQKAPSGLPEAASGGIHPGEVDAGGAGRDGAHDAPAGPALNMPPLAPLFAAEGPENYPAAEEKAFPGLVPLAQLLPTYILARGEDGLYIIDQHAAHERVLFEEFYRKARAGGFSQSLLVPLPIELTPREAEILTNSIVPLTDAGFIIEHFGQNAFLLRGVPPYFPPGREKEFFIDLLSRLERPGAPLEKSGLAKQIAASLACREAVKAGDKLTMQAMEGLVKRLSEADSPLTCPHGRPTLVQLTYRELDGRFKRQHR